MDFAQRFALNEPTVIQEIIDGEAIIADLGRGFYYSLDPIGSHSWNALVAGCSPAEIIDALAARFPADREHIVRGIEALVDRLLLEGLIVGRASGAAVLPGDHLALFASVAAFAAPVLSKYTDMEQLLLLDPIHEVDETGWPNQPDEGSEKPAGSPPRD